MKNLLFLVSIFVLTASCSKKIVQVYNVSTDSNGFNDKSSTHVFENDTVKITYDLWSSNGSMAFTVYNKTSRPIYIDWKNSFFIVNDEKFNYWSDQVITQSFSQYSDYYYSGFLLSPLSSSTVKAQKAVSVKPERITVVPPLSYFERSMFSLIPSNYTYKISENATVKVDNKQKVKTDVFSKGTTPFNYRNFISFSLSENAENLIFIDNAFFIDSISEMSYRVFRGKVIEETATEYIYSFPYRNNTSFFKIIEQ